jgi:peptidylprolyl isomerase
MGVMSLRRLSATWFLTGTPLAPASMVLALGVITACGDSGRSIRAPSGLLYTVIKEGSGPAARPGQHVLIHETASLEEGKILYSTRTGGRPVRFLLGAKQVIDGVDEAVTGMKVGERRKLIVPPALSRRNSYPEGLSPEDTLHYDVELIDIEP